MNHIEKDKNMLYFHCDRRNNPASLDINTGKFLSYGGGEVTTIPPFINVMLSSYGKVEGHINLGQVLCCIASHKAILNASEYVYRMKIADRLDSAGVQNLSYGWYTPSNDEYYHKIEDNFKDLVKYASERNGQRFSYEEFENAMAEKAILKELGIDELPANFLSHMNDYHIDRKYLRNALGWYHRIFPYFMAMNGQDEWSALRNFFATLQKYYDYCKKLNEEPPKTNNFMSEFVRVVETYRINKDKIDNEALSRYQLAHENALKFEDDNFIVIIPTTCEEFKNEANSQNNCVYRMYLPKVIEGRTNVVFVRQKNDPTHSYITCEVRNGEIIQYLAKNNHWTVGELAEEFKRNYQNHLNREWKKWGC